MQDPLIGGRRSTQVIVALSNATTAPNVTVSISADELGRVTLKIPSPGLVTIGASNNPLQLTSAVPSWGRPASPVHQAAVVKSANASAIGTLRIDTGGNVLFYNAAFASFAANTTNCSWEDVCITYMVQTP